MSTHQSHWICGASEADITPGESVFLYGYPNVQRMSTGVHDRLRSSALYISDGKTAIIQIANDIIWVSQAVSRKARQRISTETGVPVEQIMITASHTHSGPGTARMLSNAADPNASKAAPGFAQRLEDGIVAAAVEAARIARPATLAYARADGTGLGTNRHDPAGVSIPTVPVLVARDAADDSPIGVMCVCTMHPTVLHEDWKLISGDFPGLARNHLKQNGFDCPFIYHMGASGNQSPRHVVNQNTIEEADRLGRLLADRIIASLKTAQTIEASPLVCRSTGVDLQLRDLPEIAEAETRLDAARTRLQSLRDASAPRAEVRTAECDVFGAEETVTLARAASEGRLAEAAASCLPAEIQITWIGQHVWVGWPGEVFTEFALDVMREFPEASIITLANGGLQGYLVTEQAVQARVYESGNAIFQSPDSGNRLVEATLKLLGEGKA